ncbi:hypothetical protein GJ496_001652 [Pomphorhynchus laevis]|nr:hypothetical protein GJ496_001652 [Pomphorhynchus laevis]
MSELITNSLVIMMIIGIVQELDAYQCSLIENMNCDCKQSILQCETNRPIPEFRLMNFNTTPFLVTHHYKHISLNFNLSHLTIQSRFFQPLNKLLLMPNHNWDSDSVSVTLSFARFQTLLLESIAFDGIFDGFPQNMTKLSIDFYSATPTSLYTDTFKGLSVGYLELFGSNLHSNAPISFQSLFNHTSVSRLLRLEGIILPSLPSDNFYGKINRLQLSKQVHVVNSDEYPEFPVTFYSISAHNPRNIDGNSFSSYKNLRGLMIHGGNIEINENKLRGFRHLEELDLNVEQVVDNALSQVAPTLRVLTLGRKVKHIDPASLESLSSNLKKIDIRNLDFDSLSYPTRCTICDLVNTRRDKLEVLIDRQGCECHHIFILMIMKVSPLCENSAFMDVCAKYAHCQLVRDYFREARSVPSDPDSDIVTVNSSYFKKLKSHQQFKKYQQQHAADNGPAIIVDIVGDSSDQRIIDSNWIGDGSVAPAVDKSQPVDKSPSVNKEEYPPSHKDTFKENVRVPYQEASLNWIPVVVACVVLIISLIIALIIWHLNYKRRRGQFKPIPSNALI